LHYLLADRGGEEMSIAAMKQALDALTEHGAPYLRHGVDWDNAITALRTAISEHENCEPVLQVVANELYKFQEATGCDTADEFTHPAPIEKCDHVPVTTFGGDYCIKCDAPIEKAEPVAWRSISDAQWVNLVNHAHAWEGFSKDEAVHEVVKMTEAKCRENNTHPAPVPVGFQLVPVEPTDAMIRASMDLASVVTYSNGQHTHIPIAYKVMLQAAPKPGENHD
jgi:hypothetical protein